MPEHGFHTSRSCLKISRSATLNNIQLAINDLNVMTFRTGCFNIYHVIICNILGEMFEISFDTGVERVIIIAIVGFVKDLTNVTIPG